MHPTNTSRASIPELFALLKPEQLNALTLRLQSVLSEQTASDQAQLLFEFIDEGVEVTSELLNDDGKRYILAEGFLKELKATP